MAVWGCVSNVRLLCSDKHDEAATTHHHHDSSNVTREELRNSLRALTTCKKNLENFVETSQTHRDEVVAQFAEIRESLNKSERAMLVNFDSRVRAVMKAMTMELEALGIKAQQIAASIATETMFGVGENDKASTAQQTSELCKATTNLQLLKRNVVWSTVPCGGHDSQTYWKMAAFDWVEKMQCAINSVKSSVYVQHVETSLCTQFQGRCLIETPVENVTGKACGLAVSGDGRMVAIGDFVKNRIILVSLPCGTVLRCIGKPGKNPGEFCRIWALCFAPNGNLLVSDNGNKRIQELTLTGDHVRSLTAERRPIRAIHTNSEIDVIVGVSEDSVCVFDWASGDLLRQFGTPSSIQSGGYVNIRILPGNKHVAVEESDKRRVQIYTLLGEFVKDIFIDCHNLRDISILGSGKIVFAEYKDGVGDDSDDGVWKVKVCHMDGSKTGLRVFKTWLDSSYASNNWPEMCTFGDLLYTFSAQTLRVFC